MRIVSALLLVLAISGTATAEETARLGRQIDGFTLPDFHGREHSLAELAKDKQAVVIAFLGCECPLAKLYAPRLEELSKQYAERGVVVVGVNSNRQDSTNDLAAYVTQHGLSFPVLKDLENQLADRLGAVRTPEVFLLDHSGTVRYAGRIDDQYGLGNSAGYAKSAVHRRDLIDAVEELLAGREISVPETTATGCLIGRVSRVTPHGDITYAQQISRILQKHCVECHRPGEVGPFSMTSYEEVVGWAEMIRESVDQGRMPPWFANPAHGDFANDRRLSDEEKEQIQHWVANGMPEGDPSQLPPPREFVEGWQIGQPDAVFYASEEPLSVPAEGVVDYQYLTVDTNFTEDKWIQAAEARPGNRAVVHHIIVFFEIPGRGGRFNREGGQIGYAPGMQPRQFADGAAMRIPAGSRLTFQMHYTPNGSAQEDRSCVGFKFVDRSEVRKEVRGNVAGNMSFRIPPNDGNYKVTANKKFRRDTLLVSMLPHMHVRGKSFRYELQYPDGRKEILLDVPRYDFNWQLWYQLAEPKLIPKGSRMTCTAHFDNSTDNPFNPDPGAEVTWGEQTWEEMMFGFFTTLDPHQDLSLSASAESEEDDEQPEKIGF